MNLDQTASKTKGREYAIWLLDQALAAPTPYERDTWIDVLTQYLGKGESKKRPVNGSGGF